MNVELTLEFLWIPPDLGGHGGHPYSGMRVQIRWQRYLEEHLRLARDIQCSVLQFDLANGKGKVLCQFASPAPVPSAWLQDGELVELVNGSRVLAIGKIVRTQDPR
jgi:hypothetical protein